MSGTSRERSLRSLEALVRIREIEEKRALREVARSRTSFESCTAEVDAIRDARRVIRQGIEKPIEAGDDNETDAGGNALIRGRVYLEQLRSREHVRREELEHLRREWTSTQATFSEARSRRRVSETLRDKRVDELEERKLTGSESLAESDGYRVTSDGWLETTLP